MHDPTPTASPELEVTPEVTLRESVFSVMADLGDLGDLMRPLEPDIDRNAKMADRLSEELAEIAAMIRALPGRPHALSGYDYQLLAALRASVADGEDVGQAIGFALARLAAELGGSSRVTVNRPGSWEARAVAELLSGTVGPDDENLAMFGATS